MRWIKSLLTATAEPMRKAGLMSAAASSPSSSPPERWLSRDELHAQIFTLMEETRFTVHEETDVADDQRRE